MTTTKWSDAEHGTVDPNPIRALVVVREIATRQPDADET